MGTSKMAPPKPSFAAEEIALSKQIFSDDDSWIESLFADTQIQLGSGGALEVDGGGRRDWGSHD